eukprot:6462935-Amphidinium_carterae.1
MKQTRMKKMSLSGKGKGVAVQVCSMKIKDLTLRPAPGVLPAQMFRRSRDGLMLEQVQTHKAMGFDMSMTSTIHQLVDRLTLLLYKFSSTYWH